MESPHVSDMDAPCAGCGATWKPYPGENRRFIMDHHQPCKYLEDLEYGGEQELGDPS